MTKVLIIGATSKIVHEISKLFAAQGAWLYLVGRNLAKLSAVADDLRVRGASKVEISVLDMADCDRHNEMFKAAVHALGSLDVVLIGYGTLPNQRSCQENAEEALKELNVNCLSVVSIATHVVNYFEHQRRGCLAVITSVAGDRGRQSNYVYGMAKGAVSIFLQGVRHRLATTGVKVVTIKLGFVDTPMTSSLPKNFLYASADGVAKTIFGAMLNGNDEVYVPWFWRWIMLVIRCIPEILFKRTAL
jgi:decaprenylphospho-beta-D-erythro-pentofuranosid-2-ulose 2-reductase